MSKKSPFIAVALTFVFPGLGQIYSRRVGAAIGYTIMALLCEVPVYYAFFYTDKGFWTPVLPFPLLVERLVESRPLFEWLQSVTFVGWLGAMLDAFLGARQKIKTKSG